MSEQPSQDRQPDLHLTRKLERNLRERCEVDPGERLLVGVSGGADSVALLHLLCAIAAAMDLKIEVAHFDHGLRPDAADDARFVADLAHALHLPVHIERWEQPRTGEDAARRARHDFMDRIAQEHDCHAIALAHQLQDQIETVLFRLGRGTGIRGALGMSWRRPGRVDIIRPLLDFKRETLLSYLQSHDLQWREDPSNADSRLSRNGIRHGAIPALEHSLGTSWMEHWGSQIEDLRGIWSWLESSATELLERARIERSDADTCRVPVLRAAPEPVLRHALQKWLESAGATDVARSHLKSAQDLLENGQSDQRVEVPGGVCLVLEQGLIRITRLPAHPQTSSGAETVNPAAYSLDLEAVPLAIALQECDFGTQSTRPEKLPSTCEAIIASDQLTMPLVIRSLHPGERVQLLGAPGRRKVVRILQDRRIPRRLRAAWPVIADDEGIVWIPQVGVAERARVRPQSQNSLRLRLHPARIAVRSHRKPDTAVPKLAEPGGAA